LSLREDDRLVEMNFGAWEGQRWEAIARNELDAWTADFRHWRCGGAESVGDIMHRVGAALEDTKASTHAAVWITHAGVIRAARLIANGQATIERADQWPVQAPSYGAWCEIAY
jgi:alpha-ribazole phosphatase